MTIEKKLRDWATPITIGAFALSALTGIMLFFHIQPGLVKPAHEWLSWLLVLGTIFHVLGNRSPFMEYFSKPIGRGIMIVFLLLICASMLPLGPERGKHPLAKVADALNQSSLTTVAQIANHEPDEAMNILKNKGIYAESEDQTIQEIARNNKMNPLRILDAIF